MNWSIALAGLWGLVANVMAMIPSKDNHWTRAYFLIAVGIPILGYVTYENGPWIGLIVLAAGISVLRWPVIYLGRWLRKWI
ncbi:DUF2484 family protein [Ruegeria arenilitoris]|uniref:DUF2484 family protein n=1 Tax=Ruegeria arenilitoris TaxID=1173585 RepID=UPI00147FAB1F|nr:DUF2484 family protein [Ruegeria arenilitoris]